MPDALPERVALPVAVELEAREEAVEAIIVEFE